ncbi:MAG: hypothetical protein EOO40_10070 [Deltaproteobacteria bacterium]|nr:MAG: hypothetical protein EOO40_10070 [Deltaproteobacteria bacterium]
MRIHGGGISTSLQNTQAPISGQAHQAPTVGEQVTQALFGKGPPPLLDPARFPEFAAMLKQLGRFRNKFSVLSGEDERDFSLHLADSDTAHIDGEGRIYLGAGFLRRNANNPAVVIGALAHEIGHRPLRWKGRRGAHQQQLTLAEMNELCQIEETAADLFAGEALAELGISCEPLIEFLTFHEDGPHPRYLPALDRGEIIRQAHARRAAAIKQRKQIFPNYHRHKGVRSYISKL